MPRRSCTVNTQTSNQREKTWRTIGRDTFQQRSVTSQKRSLSKGMKKLSSRASGVLRTLSAHFVDVRIFHFSFMLCECVRTKKCSPESHCVFTGAFGTTTGPDRLLSDISPSMRRVDHDSSLHKDSDVCHRATSGTIAPEKHITRLCISPLQMLSHGRSVLLIGCSRNCTRA